MAVSQDRAHPPPITMVVIFAENTFPPTSLKMPNPVQKPPAGYVRRCPRVDLQVSREDQFDLCRVGKFRRVVKRRCLPVGICGLGEFGASWPLLACVRRGWGGSTYPGVVVQGRSVSLQRVTAVSPSVTSAAADSTYPGVVVQGRSVLLQRVTAHSPSVTSAVAFDLPWSADFKRLWRREQAADGEETWTGRKPRISSSLPCVVCQEGSSAVRDGIP